jgi:hypothetical protein
LQKLKAKANKQEGLSNTDSSTPEESKDLDTGSRGHGRGGDGGRGGGNNQGYGRVVGTDVKEDMGNFICWLEE